MTPTARVLIACLLCLGGIVVAPAHRADAGSLPVRIHMERRTKAAAGARTAYRFDDIWYDRVYETPEGNFAIWYNPSGYGAPGDLSDDDRDGVPDYVEAVGAAFEYAWTKEIDELGYTMPVDADRYLYNVWLEPSSDTYGYTIYNSGQPVSYSEIVINSHLSPASNYEAIRLTAAHEFFHAIQAAYDTTEPVWWMEGSAVWMEELLYDAANGYDEFVTVFFEHPEIGFEYGDGSYLSPDLREYAAFLFVQYVSETRHFSTIRTLWELSAGPRTVDEAMDGLPVSFAETMRGFLTWAYTGGFEESDRMPEPAFHSRHGAYPVDRSPLTRLPNSLGANYILFRPDETATSHALTVTFDAEEDQRWIATLVATGTSGTTALPLALDPTGGSARLEGFGSAYTEACLVVSPLASGQSGCAYRYRATVEASSAPPTASGSGTVAVVDDTPDIQETQDAEDDDKTPPPSSASSADTDGGAQADEEDTKVPADTAEPPASATGDGNDTPSATSGETDDDNADGSATPSNPFVSIADTAGTTASGTLAFNRSLFRAGDAMRLGVSIEGRGRVDVYVVLRMPWGERYSLVAPSRFGPVGAFAPLLRDWEVAAVHDAELLRLESLPPLPAGTYTATLTLVEAGGSLFEPSDQVDRTQATFSVE